MNKYVESDLFRYAGSTKLSAFIKWYIKSSAFRYQVAFRLNREGGLLGRILWLFRPRKGSQIAPEANIGYGLLISHGGPVIINGTAVIGNNCHLSHLLR